MSLAGAPMLAGRGLNLHAGRRELVRGLDLQVNAGERWVVLGPNGAGKSTLLATLAGVRSASRGQIVLAGRELEDWTVEQMAEQRALVTDRWHDPFSASVLDTVLTARYRLGAADAAGERVARAWLTEFDCASLVEHDVTSLSRGERQRVALATALAQDTPLVLLDEPIAHQDPRHQVLVLDRLARAQQRTLIASLHDMNAAVRFATHALLLTGRGDWMAGRAAEMLTAPRLSALFDTDVITLPRQGGAPAFSIGG
ncbi:MAG: ABC transporter ATP-binding protein [Gemmatimonadota bacterium]